MTVNPPPPPPPPRNSTWERQPFSHATMSVRTLRIVLIHASASSRLRPVCARLHAAAAARPRTESASALGRGHPTAVAAAATHQACFFTAPVVHAQNLKSSTSTAAAG
eukprot:3469895-Pleurochrysis_carterae.AAC.2